MSGALLNNYLSSNYSNCYYASAGIYKDGVGFGGIVPGFTTNNTIGVAYDADVGTMGMYKNNSLVYTFTGLSQTPRFPVMSIYSTAGATANFGATPLTYTPPNGTFWNPADSRSGTFTNNNMTYQTNESSYYALARANTAKSSGKWYFEVTAVSGIANIYSIGVAGSATALTALNGNTATSWAYSSYSSGKKVHADWPGTAYGTSYTDGDIVGVAVDFDNGTLTFYKNGTSQGQAFTGVSGTLYPSVSFASSPATNGKYTLNTGVSDPTFGGRLPSGYSAWDATTYNAGLYQ